MNSCGKFGKSQDKLGMPVGFGYRGSPEYGTILGGYVSICARIFILVLATMQIYSCFTDPYNIALTKFSQLSMPNAQEYNIKIDEGLPAFFVYSPTTGNYNDPDLFTFKFSNAKSVPDSADFTEDDITARNCTEVIEAYVSDEKKRESILREFNDVPFLCPDVAEYELFVSAW